MTLSMIAAIGRNNELGKKNNLIWRISEDLKFFRTTTTGNTIIMGRKTFESLPHALPNRRNVVITTNPDYKAEGAEVVFGVDEALKLVENDENAYIIGGASIYKAFIPFADKLILTEIDGEDGDADAFFPEFSKDDYTAELLGEYDAEGLKYKRFIYTRK